MLNYGGRVTRRRLEGCNGAISNPGTILEIVVTVPDDFWRNVRKEAACAKASGRPQERHRNRMLAGCPGTRICRSTGPAVSRHRHRPASHRTRQGQVRRGEKPVVPTE